MQRETQNCTLLNTCEHKCGTDAYFTLGVRCQHYIPCSKVSVDETLFGEVLHSISNFHTESQQLLWQVNIFLAQSMKQFNK